MPVPATVAKKRARDTAFPDDLTVEAYLKDTAERMAVKMRTRVAAMTQQLRSIYEAERESTLRSLEEGESAAKAAAKPAAIVVTFEAIEGPYTGQAYVLRPSEGAAKIGRSTGKLFKTRGISMPEDQEVSTTHAKVEVLDDQPVLIDVGSTNGTFYNGEDLEEHKPLPLATGQEIGIGQTVFRVTIAIE